MKLHTVSPFCSLMIVAASAASDHVVDEIKDPKDSTTLTLLRGGGQELPETAEAAFQHVSNEPIANNFISSTTQSICSGECGCVGSCRQGEQLHSFFEIIKDIGDNADNDYFVHGYDGSGGFNYLTSTNTVATPLCPSKVEFDFSMAFATKLKSAHGIGDRTLSLQVIDATETVVFSLPIPSATIEASKLYHKKKNHINVDVTGEGFSECLAGAKLRFAWNMPKSPDFLRTEDDGSTTTPSAGQFILDNVSVTPLSMLEEVNEEKVNPQSLPGRKSGSHHAVDPKFFYDPNFQMSIAKRLRQSPTGYIYMTTESSI